MTEDNRGWRSKTIRRLAMAAGVLFMLAGATFCVMYVLEAIIKRLGEADQSLLFWYLPILFIGIFSVMAGLGLWAWARRGKRN